MKKIRFKKGAAMVEFAIISTLLIPITLYTSFFTDLLHFRNKVDEMNYFAAWEITAYSLSDYKGDPTATSAFDKSGATMVTAINDIKKRTRARYSKLDSADNTHANSSFIMLGPVGTGNNDDDSSNFTFAFAEAKTKSLNDLFTPPIKTVNTGSASGFLSAVLNNVSSYLNKGANWVTGDWLGFNTKDVAVTFSISASFNVSDKTIAGNNTFRENKGMFAESAMYDDSIINGTGTTYTSAPFTVVSETWTLNDGRDIKPTPKFSTVGTAEDFGYRSQVQRMYLVGAVKNMSAALNSIFPGANGVTTAMNKIGGFLGINVCSGSLPLFNLLGGFDPFCAKVASINYDDMYLSRQGVNVTANGVGNSGIYNKNVDRGQTLYETTPLLYARNNNNFSDVGDNETPQYVKTLNKRRNYYMGHWKPQCHYTGTTEQDDRNVDNVKCK